MWYLLQALSTFWIITGKAWMLLKHMKDTISSYIQMKRNISSSWYGFAKCWVNYIGYILGRGGVDKFTKLVKKRIFYGMFLAQLLKFPFWVSGGVLASVPSTPSVLGIFLKLPNFVSVESFGSSWDNSNIHLLVIII